MARTTGVSRQTIRKILRGQRHDTFRNRQSSLDAWSMMRSKDEARLDPWIATAAASKLAGIEADNDAVAAAISSPWSSGQVEGAATRLKSIKRQMYVRAKLDLLKIRVMAPA